MISERTRDALQHMKAQGVRLGPAPYGYELSHECDDKGRRLLVPLAHEQEVLRKVESLRADGLSLRDIARRLNEANLSARRDGTWRPQRISIVLQRSGKHTVRPTQKPGPRIPLRYDREAATARAKELRVQGLSLNKIGLLLRKEQLTPLRGAPQSDREAAVRRASKLCVQGMHLREIGVRLVVEGFLPKEGGHLAAVFRACPAGEPRATCPGWMTARRNARVGAARPRPSPHRRPRKSASPLDSVALV